MGFWTQSQAKGQREVNFVCVLGEGRRTFSHSNYLILHK